MNQAYSGMRSLYRCTTGVPGSAVPASGGTGPAWMFDSISAPLDAAKEYRYWIESHTFPAGFLPPDDFGAGSLVGLPDGVYTATVALYEWDVLIGRFVVVVLVGQAQTYAAPRVQVQATPLPREILFNAPAAHIGALVRPA